MFAVAQDNGELISGGQKAGGVICVPRHRLWIGVKFGLVLGSSKEAAQIEIMKPQVKNQREKIERGEKEKIERGEKEKSEREKKEKNEREKKEKNERGEKEKKEREKKDKNERGEKE